MPRKYGTSTGEFLKLIGEATGFFHWPPEHSEGWRLEQLKISRKRTNDLVYHMRRRGWVVTAKEGDRTFLKLTAKGELEMLMRKTHMDSVPSWDGKWRMILYDIPEDSRHKRDLLRRLLKQHKFLEIQHSVYISPHPLNRDAVEYLKKSGLMAYIRIFRVDEADDERWLKRKFKMA